MTGGVTMRTVRTLHFVAVLVGLAVLGPRAASAAFISIDDTTVEGSVTITAGDFEGGFSANGVLLSSGLGTSGSLTVDEALGPLTFSGSWIDLGASGAGSTTQYMVEPSDPTTVSDILSQSWSTDGTFGTINGTFTSDSGLGLGLLPPDAVPSGELVDFSHPFLSASATSDVADVPAPAALVLLGAGIAG